jgi:hypothetical protein
MGIAAYVTSARGFTAALTESFTGSGSYFSSLAGLGNRLGLKQAGPNEFISYRSGLRYATDPILGNRANHILKHTVDDLARASDKHGVFDVGGMDAFNLIDDACTKVRIAGYKNSADVSVSAPGWNGRVTYVVNMRARIGYLGGRAGASQGNPSATHVMITVESDLRSVVTSYPIIP